LNHLSEYAANDKNEAGGGVCACLIIRVLFLVVELQRKLDIP
jgi:hypothetical protein